MTSPLKTKGRYLALSTRMLSKSISVVLYGVHPRNVRDSDETYYILI